VRQDLLPDTLKGPLRPRYSDWNSEKRCRGKVKRGICVFGLGDLAKLKSFAVGSFLFHNKFSAKVDSGAIACWTEQLWPSVYEELYGL